MTSYPVTFFEWVRAVTDTTVAVIIIVVWLAWICVEVIRKP